MNVEMTIRLLRCILDGAQVEECYREAGYSSLEKAFADLVALESILRSKISDAKTRKRGKGEYLIINVDGASRGNPGPSSAAAIAYYQNGNRAGTRTVKLGKKTNNEAEYSAVIEGLKLALELGWEKVLIRLDSELVYNQLKGNYRLKSKRLRDYFNRVKELMSSFDEVLFERIDRSKNKEVDKLANMVLDGTLGRGE